MLKMLTVLAIGVPEEITNVCAHFGRTEVILEEAMSHASAIDKISRTDFDLIIVNDALDAGAPSVIKTAKEHNAATRIICMSHDPITRDAMKKEGCHSVAHPDRTSNAILAQLKWLVKHKPRPKE